MGNETLPGSTCHLSTQPDDAAGTRRREGWALTVLHGPGRSRPGRIHRVDAPVYTIGRASEDVNLPLDDPRVSRLHASLRWDQAEPGYALVDEGSRNGTSCNGAASQRCLLGDGDILRFGDSVLRFGAFDLGMVGWEPPEACLLAGRSPALRDVLADVARVAPTDLSVLIQGATGTGKELVAREIHRQSRRSGSFVALNCAAIPVELMESELFGHRRGAFSGAVRDHAGVMRSAHGGTVFLDEVGELAGPLQAKLLRVLEEGLVRPVGSVAPVPVDVRFVSATNRKLEEAAIAGSFRADLYARLAPWPIHLRPLRERPEDILPIAEQVFRRHGGALEWSLSGELLEGLALHSWPFNVRELIALLRRAMIRSPGGGRLGREHLPSKPAQPPRGSEGHAGQGASLGGTPGRAELTRLLNLYQGNVSRVAVHLGKDRTQIYRWLRRLGLSPQQFRPSEGG